jgi:multiple sugar transport system substrate-binding protein
MAQEIEFSIMASNAAGIQPLLAQFEAENGIHVRLRLLAWDTAWSYLVKAAIYNDGPDVSEIGTTWVGDLIGMNALRSFNTAEVTAVGKASAYFPAAWKTVKQDGDMHVWSIPWVEGSRLIYYRPALFDQAGVDPQTAFGSIEAFEQTLDRLQASGIKIPWTVPTGTTHTTLLNIASWVWAAGGDFISPDGKSTRFIEPEALAGMSAYFRLGRFLAPQVRHLNGLEPDEQFLSSAETAMTCSGPWLFCSARERQQKIGNLADPVAIALPPGASFVGGSNLVVWKHSHHADAAIKLIRFLTQAAAQVSYSQFIGLLPVRMEALSLSPFSEDPCWQMAVKGLKSGRSFPTIRLWGLIEDRLRVGLSAVWADVLAHPEADPRISLVQHLAPIAQRLDVLLRQG